MRKLFADYDSEEDDDYQPTKFEEAAFKSQLQKNRKVGLGGRINVNELFEELERDVRKPKKVKTDPTLSTLELAQRILTSKQIRTEKKVMFAGKEFIMDEHSGELRQVERPAVVMERQEEAPQEITELDQLSHQYRYLNHVVSMLKSRYRNINSVYKSKMDWKNFVKKEGIEDRLIYNRKGGALEDYRFMKKKQTIT